MLPCEGSLAKLDHISNHRAVTLHTPFHECDIRPNSTCSTTSAIMNVDVFRGSPCSKRRRIANQNAVQRSLQQTSNGLNSEPARQRPLHRYTTATACERHVSIVLLAEAETETLQPPMLKTQTGFTLHCRRHMWSKGCHKR